MSWPPTALARVGLQATARQATSAVEMAAFDSGLWMEFPSAVIVRSPPRSERHDCIGQLVVPDVAPQRYGHIVGDRSFVDAGGFSR